jgi:uncharacterized metal-binding protein YceD (DUF177 family)
MKAPPPPVLRRRIAAADVHGALAVELAASVEERGALARAYGLLEVRSLAASANLTGGIGGSLEVEGRITADIVQACVVSLAPVEQHIDEPFAVRFVPPSSPELAAPTRAHAEMVVDPAAPDPPEAMTEGGIDLGAVVEEAFVLAIDPYPRAPDATLPAELASPEAAGDSPFAALAALRTGKEKR